MVDTQRVVDLVGMNAANHIAKALLPNEKTITAMRGIEFYF